MIKQLQLILLLLNLYISALKCYQGTGDSAILSSCTGSPIPDRCTKETNSGTVTYACGLASDIIIQGSVFDDACHTINSVEICVCNTDGCNDPSATAFSCYQGAGDSAVLSSCVRYPPPDRCIKTISGGVDAYACASASDIIIEGSVADNACSTINSVEICVCNTDGCNPFLGNLQLLSSFSNVLFICKLQSR